MPVEQVKPEILYVPPTAHSPNSKLPVVVYRNALTDPTPDGVLQAVEESEWKKGGHWKIAKESLAATPHYHSTTHEAYTVLHGAATYLLGKSPLDPGTDSNGDSTGVRFTARAGDVFVFPAGVTHFVTDVEDEYEFIGFYSLSSQNDQNSLKEPYNMEYATDSIEITNQKRGKCELVPVPAHDPIYGEEGPMIKIWKSV
ncbi:uncharacterized protein N7483_008112 [Penicillium malachiteum]|uniref:uncharacterized protein n=1 Tax=Penicillium malachiteum TaxID=1324776 RepID=UPI002548E386|nr:uncharacterized protein N7483_008112 [Penicillium malachiteum]KAJ5726755.1 hypothetical protein N7483_008112 [Penicillium malachiteum]